MANLKSGLSYLLNNSRVAPLLGGGDADGFLEGWFKTAKHRARLAPFWSGDSSWGLSVVSTITYRLPSGTEELIYQLLSSRVTHDYF